MSFEVGDQALRALAEKGPKTAHKVYAKIANSLKISTMSVKRAHFLEISGPLDPSQGIKFMGPGGTSLPSF